MYKIYVWLNRNNNSYYFKVGKGTYKYNKVNQINQYNHKLVLIIPINHFMEQKKYKVSYRKMLINDLIRFLEKVK